MSTLRFVCAVEGRRYLKFFVPGKNRKTLEETRVKEMDKEFHGRENAEDIIKSKNKRDHSACFVGHGWQQSKHGRPTALGRA